MSELAEYKAWAAHQAVAEEFDQSVGGPSMSVMNVLVHNLMLDAVADAASRLDAARHIEDGR